MRIGKYDISADKHQFILSEVKINATIKDGVKGKNYGEEQLVNPCYPQSWEAVVNKLIKLKLMASVKEFDTIEAVTSSLVDNLASLEDEVREALGAEQVTEGENKDTD